MPNSSSVSEFLLLAFADTRELQLLHFALFLGIYLAALLGNGLILSAVACHHRLHTPMYFFLLNLALLDLGCISTTLPKAMANALWDTRAISYQGCAAQVLFFVFFFAAEYSILTVMAYDRYVAICKPLHYGSLLGSRACAQMAAAAWGSGFLNAVLHTANTFSLPLCQGNAVDQFFCEIPQILKLSCSDAYLREVWAVLFSIALAFGCFVFIVFSYVQIFRAVLRMPSSQGRHKAFSTCLPHLAVVSLMVSTGIFSYLKPPSISSPSLDLVVALLCSVVPPAVNPLIYSMRNQELKNANHRNVEVGMDLQTSSNPTPLLKQGSLFQWEVPVDWQLANLTAIYKKGQKDNSGNCRPVGLTSVTGKFMEQIVLTTITEQFQDHHVIRPSQNLFIKGRSCLTNAISFYDKVMHSVDEGNAVDVVHLEFILIFISDLDEEMECALSKFADNTKLGTSIDLLEDRHSKQVARLQEELGRLQCIQESEREIDAWYHKLA
ncbi:olfactory receptor 14C36-like [Mergus octosetaceus]